MIIKSFVNPLEGADVITTSNSFDDNHNYVKVAEVNINDRADARVILRQLKEIIARVESELASSTKLDMDKIDRELAQQVKQCMVMGG